MAIAAASFLACKRKILILTKPINSFHGSKVTIIFGQKVSFKGVFSDTIFHIHKMNFRKREIFKNSW